MYLSSRNIIFSIFLILIASMALQDGMFMDGQLYGIVAKNLAFGESSFWKPWLSDSYLKSGKPYFMEHPPFGFFLQSIAFKILGSSLYTERIYEIIMALIHIFFIGKIWQIIPFSNEKNKSFFELPIFLWLIIPLVFWSFANNVMENTMGVFTSASIYFGVKFILKEKFATIEFLLYVLFIFLASFTKGFPGFFPLALFGIACISLKNISLKQSILYTIYSLGILAILYTVIVISSADAKEYLWFYVYERVFHRTQTELVTNSHFYIFQRVFSELLPTLIFVLLLFIYEKIKTKKISIHSNEKRWGLFFVLLGIAGSCPIAITLVQKGFYALPSFLPFAIGIAIFGVSSMIFLKENLSDKFLYYFKRFSFILLMASFVYTFSRLGKTGRDFTDLKNAKTIASCIPSNTYINTTHPIFESWAFQFFLIRYYDITLNVLERKGPYYMFAPEEKVDPSFTEIPCDLKDFKIYKKLN